MWKRFYSDYPEALKMEFSLMRAHLNGCKNDSICERLKWTRSLALGAGWSVEPQLQLVHQRLSLDGSAIVGARVQHDTPGNWSARGHV